jgi:AmiR/NasT family two-component response regulator
MTFTPNFVGRKCLVLHRSGETVNVLTRQLSVIGMNVSAQWQALNLNLTPADVVLVDADAGWPGLLPWEFGSPHVPLIALLGSEAPSRIKWALDQGVGAIISKPVSASAVYPALVMAFHAHASARRQAEEISILEERLRLRPLVTAAISQMMGEANIDEAAAHRRLRQEAMQTQQTLEHVAAALLARGKGRAAV